jgi:hypothetical protein
MVEHKVNSSSENSIFVRTKSYKKTEKAFKYLKKSKGHILHIVGAPGTGKSTNIYHGLEELDLNVYEVGISLSKSTAGSREVLKTVTKDLKKSLNVDSKEKAYDYLSKYDIVLIADQFHDAHIQNDGLVGFSLWTQHAGYKSAYFYILCIIEYLKYIKEFKKMNIVFQTAWRVRFNGEKYDLFTDLGVISKLALKLLGTVFCAVEIKYSPEETINIVKKHYKDIDEKNIQKCIDKYGCKPRFILKELKNY